MQFTEHEVILGDEDTLVSLEPVTDGDNIVIVKNDNSIHDVIASGVTVEYDKAYTSLDPFGDNSLIHKTIFENNIDSIVGTSFVEAGSPSYDVLANGRTSRNNKGNYLTHLNTVAPIGDIRGKTLIFGVTFNDETDDVFLDHYEGTGFI